MRSHSRIAAVALLVVAVFVISEQDARADTVGNGPVVLLVAMAAGGASVPFLVADVAYTVHRRWLPPGWAIPQILIGGGLNATAAGMMIYRQNSCYSPGACGSYWHLEIPAAVLSVGFIAHGVASLVLYEPPPVTKASDRTGLKSASAYLRWVPDIVVTRDRHTFVAFSGVF